MSGETLVDANLAPDYILRSYAWGILKRNMSDVWDETKYDGLIPIVPLSEEPELEDFSGPHIIYGFTMDTGGDLWAQKSGTMTFAIYDDNFRRLTKTMNVLSKAFERADESAADVNKFSSWYTVNSQKVFLGIRFGSIKIGFVEGGSPDDQEGGRQSGLFNIRFDYFVEYDVVTDIVT